MRPYGVRLLFPALILLLYALPISGAQSFTQTCIITNNMATPQDCVYSAIPLMFVGIMISLAIMALVYIAGNIANYEPLKDWYRGELWETVKSVILVGVILSSLVIASGVADALAGQSTSLSAGGTGGMAPSQLSGNLATLYNVAQNSYLEPQLMGLYKAYSGMAGLSLGVGLLKSVTISAWFPIPIPLPFVSVTLQSGFKTALLKSNYISTAAIGEYSPVNPVGPPTLISEADENVLIPTLLAFQVQYDLFPIIVGFGLGVLIPIGMILRAFPIFRGIGGALIAYGIGAAIIYPTLLVVFNLPVSNYFYSFQPANQQQATCSAMLGSGVTSALLCTALNAVISFEEGAVGFFTGTIPTTLAFGTFATASSGSQFTGVAVAGGQGFLTGFLTPLVPTNAGGIYPSLNFVIDTMVGPILQFILLILDLMIGIIAADGIARLLGGRLMPGFGSFKLW